MGVSRPFRAHDGYDVICARCGAEFFTSETQGVCRCGVAYEIMWQAGYHSPVASATPVTPLTPLPTLPHPQALLK